MYIVWLFPEADEVGVDTESDFEQMIDQGFEGGLLIEKSKWRLKLTAHRIASSMAKRQNLTYGIPAINS